MSIPITWIPEHPSYACFSMQRYWRFLDAARKQDDPYECRSIVPLPHENDFLGRGKFSRAWARKVSYPLTIKSAKQSSIVHILDHSWADMLAYVPKNTRKVVTMHDLIPLRDFTGLTSAQLERFRKRVSYIKQADYVIADSSYTREEGIHFLGLDPSRVCVIPCGVIIPETSPKNPSSDGSLRIGSLGSHVPRKNLRIFPRALHCYRSLTTRFPTFLRAGESLDPELSSLVRSAVGENQFKELGKCSDEQLEAFFASLDVLVVPSLYEGFGLPVLEAMARGIPVIAARTSSLPEVGGDAALYFDPNDPEELAQRLLEASNPSVAMTLSQAGLERAKLFSWRASLEGFYQAYDQLLG